MEALFVIHKKLAKTQISTNRQMDKQTVVYPYDGILLNNNKEQTIDLSNSMMESQNH